MLEEKRLCIENILNNVMDESEKFVFNGFYCLGMDLNSVEKYSKTQNITFELPINQKGYKNTLASASFKFIVLTVLCPELDKNQISNISLGLTVCHYEKIEYKNKGLLEILVSFLKFDTSKTNINDIINDDKEDAYLFKVIYKYMQDYNDRY